MKVYLAGPISGLTYDDCTRWREVAASFLKGVGVETRSPMRDKKQFDTGERLTDRFDGEMDAVAQDLTDIQEVDFVLANFTGCEKVSIGTCCEIGYAHALEKPIITVLPKGNLHDHLFINEMSAVVYDTLSQALQHMNREAHDLVIVEQTAGW